MRPSTWRINSTITTKSSNNSDWTDADFKAHSQDFTYGIDIYPNDILSTT